MGSSIQMQSHGKEPGSQSESNRPSRHLDLLLCVDAQTLLTRHPQPSQDPQAPTLIDGTFVHALCQHPEGLTDRQGDLLEIATSAGQTLHVRTVALALRAEHTVVTYQFELEHHVCLTPPAQAMQQGLLIAPNADCPEQLRSAIADDYFWRTKVISAGDTRCALDLMLVDSACVASGYFRWATTLRLGLA